ncbi:MAG: PQQ-binding-like beta-propeller repeat protein [Desulfuromonadales bacterium]
MLVRHFLPFLLLLCLAACAGRAPRIPELHLRDAQLDADASWRGRVFIDGTIRVDKGITLTILPGTEIFFLRQDRDGDALGDGGLVIEGALHAEGTQLQPIRFRSAAAAPQAGDWRGIRLDASPEARLRWCHIADAASAVDARFAQGTMEDCTLRGNLDGGRFAQATFAIRNCLIEENAGNGLDFRQARMEVARNILRYNGVGVYLRESDPLLRIAGNNFYGNGDNLHQADAGEVRPAGNWWGTADFGGTAATIHDRQRDPGRGTVIPDPVSAWVAETGPRERLSLREAWRFATGGFVDAGPVAGAGAVYVPSWDGALYALDREGKLLWQKKLGDVLDAVAVLEDGAVYIQNWQREVYALDRRDGREIWRFSYSPSPADNYRQGGLLQAADLLLAPGWNGYLYALDRVTGSQRWQADAGQPLRAAPVADGDLIYQTSGAGWLSAWENTGKMRWQAHLGAPLLASAAITPDGPVAINSDGLLVALDRAGQERWRRHLGEVCFYAAPLYHDRALYVGTAEGHLWKLEATSGRILWRFAATGPLYAQPLPIGRRLIVGDNSGSLLVVGADSGELLASFRAEGEIQGRPALLGDRIVFGSRDHRVYAVEMVEPEASAQK